MRADDDPSRLSGFFESFDALAHVLRDPAAGHTAPDRGAADALERPVFAEAAPACPVYRPSLRLPMALVLVVDDGREDGEIVRMRGDRLVIGRSEGDIVVTHDVLMSPRHAQIERAPQGGWRLTDLGSASGTFVRVDQARLRDGRMIQIGATRLRFQEIDLTEAWLVELSPSGVGRRHECHAPVTTLGRSGCTICLDDRFVDEVHVEIRRVNQGWRIRNVGANGLWVKIDDSVELHATAQFLCGEQRFVFEPLA